MVAGAFDPTGITKLVSSTMTAGALMGEVAYVKGPKSKASRYLNHANKEIFEPRGLKVSIVSGKELRKLLGLDPTFKLCAPLTAGWEMSSKDPDPKCRVVTRQIYQLLPYVHDLVLASVANDEIALESSHSYRKAAESVRIFQNGSETHHQLERSEALRWLAAANSAVDPVDKEKLERKAKVTDKEVPRTERINWLVVWNADGDGTAAVAPTPNETAELIG